MAEEKSAKQVLKSIGIENDGNMSNDGQYVVDIPDSNEYMKIYSLLEKNDDLQELVANSLITEHIATVSYLYGDEDAEIILTADLDSEEYRLVVNMYEFDEENEDEEGEE